MRKRYALLLIFLFALFSLSIAQETIKLTWDPSTDNVGVTGYNIWIDAVYHGTSPTNEYILTLDPGVYYAAVSAFDAAGNESEKSVSLRIEIPEIDGEPPTVPTNLMIVYPNPNTGEFTVTINKPLLENSILQILSLNGQIIYSRPIEDYERAHNEIFELRDKLDQGIYVIALIENGQRIGHTYVTITG